MIVFLESRAGFETDHKRIFSSDLNLVLKWTKKNENSCPFLNAFKSLITFWFGQKTKLWTKLAKNGQKLTENGQFETDWTRMNIHESTTKYRLDLNPSLSVKLNLLVIFDQCTFLSSVRYWKNNLWQKDPERWRDGKIIFLVKNWWKVNKIIFRKISFLTKN